MKIKYKIYESCIIQNRIKMSKFQYNSDNDLEIVLDNSHCDFSGIYNNFNDVELVENVLILKNLVYKK